MILKQYKVGTTFQFMFVPYIIHLMYHKSSPVIFIESRGGAANHTRNGALLQDKLQRSSQNRVCGSLQHQ